MNPFIYHPSKIHSSNPFITKRKLKQMDGSKFKVFYQKIQKNKYLPNQYNPKNIYHNDIKHYIKWGIGSDFSLFLVL